ncbi:LPXTG cell wall anchor domain-containing protein [Microbacterium sp. SZ1]|uniref:LPXTG cell wall anchor domain-containing protein n=1 Tax=Microbacterium sp. SZ1 TaxID=1849736 RepID=UPI000BBBB3E5|nr:LPXTG cell wall anchor domain-containing protein [Microbacterium sp. SZ1]
MTLGFDGALATRTGRGRLSCSARLAVTGGEVAAWVVVAALVLLASAGALLLIRRRRTTEDADQLIG